MSAYGLYRSIVVRWTSAVTLNATKTEVWGSATNNRANAILLDTVPSIPGAQQRWIHTGRAPGETLYYWLRHRNGIGTISTWFPSGATAGWPATATGLPGADVVAAARVVTLTDAATVTPNADTTDIGILATLSQATQLNTPTGSPLNGQMLILRITSSSARALTWQSGYRSTAAATLPASTTGGGTPDYIVLRYHAADAKWDCLWPALQSSVSFASRSETTAGSSTTKAVNPDGLAHSAYGRVVVQLAVSDPNGAALTTGDGKAYFRVPSTLNGYNLIEVAAQVSTVSSSGLPTIQIRNVTDSVDMLSTKITIDASEKDSSTAATPAVIDTSVDDVATADQLAIDVDVAGTGTKGLLVEMHFQLP